MNVDLKEIINGDREKIFNQSESNLNFVLQSHRQNYEKHLNDVKMFENTMKDTMAKISKKTSGLSPSGIAAHSLSRYEELVNLMKTRQTEYSTIFNTTDELKKYRLDLQKAINFLLNSLLDDDVDAKKNFDDKIKTILRILNGEICAVTSILTVNTKKHPKGLLFSNS